MTVVYSAECPDGKLASVDPNHTKNGILVKVQVSKVTVGSRPFSDIEAALGEENIKKMIDVLKITIDKGTAIYNFWKKYNIGGALKAIQGVGSVVSGIIKFIPEGEDPIVKGLESLENEVKQLGEKLATNIDEVKSFLSEVKFFVKIMTPTSVLWKHMRDCMKHPGPEAKINFEKAYHRQSPLQLTYALMSLLENKSTNPIGLAMESVKNYEAEVRRATFRKWTDIIGWLLAHFMILEAFATGLLKFETQFNIDQLLEESDQIVNKMRELNEEYEDKNYWEEMRSWMEGYIPSHTNLNNDQKANEIAARLNSYFTSAAFYICVFNEYGVHWEYAYHCSHGDAQVIAVMEQGLCNAIIYRSRTANYMPDWEYKNTENEVKACRNRVIYSGDKFEDIIRNQLINKTRVRPDGFIGLVRESKNLRVKNANCQGHKWGPGWYEKVVCENDSRDVFTLLVGLP